MKRFEDALDSFDRAIALRPDFASAHYGRAVTLNEMQCAEVALRGYERAFALEPNSPFLFGKLVNMKMANCDWKDFGRDTAELGRRIARGEKVSPPFQPRLSFLPPPQN